MEIDNLDALEPQPNVFTDKPCFSDTETWGS